MLLTKECDYGVRIIRALADGTKKTVETMAAEEQIPQKYAYKIVSKLVQAGFITSTRGRTGGYVISKPLSEFTLIDIITAVDAHRYVNDCLRPGSACVFRDDPDNSCKVHVELEQIQELVVAALRAKTMDEVLQIDSSTFKGASNVR